MVPIVRFETPRPEPPPCHRLGCALWRDVVASDASLDRLRALLELPRYFAHAGHGWWWLMRDGGGALVTAASAVVRSFPAIGAARVARAELELLHTWCCSCPGWQPHTSRLGGPSRGLFRAVTRLSVEPGDAEAAVQVLQSHTFNKAPGCQARWLRFLERALSPGDLHRVRSLARRSGASEDAGRHAERLRQLALDFAQLCVR